MRALLEDAASRRQKPSDWVYVNNFATPHRPVAIALPPGRAPALDKALDELIDDLKVSLPAAFESEDYQKRRGAIEQEIRGRNERGFTALRDKATAKGIAILRTPMGFAMAPMKDGQVVPPAEFNAWPAERQHEVQAAIEELEKDLEDTLRGLPRQERELRDAVRALDQRNGSLRHRAADRGVQGTVRRPAEGDAAPRSDPGRHPGERRAVHRAAGARRGADRTRPAACSIATRSTCWSRAGTARPARR